MNSDDMYAISSGCLEIMCKTRETCAQDVTSRYAKCVREICLSYGVQVGFESYCRSVVGSECSFLFSLNIVVKQIDPRMREQFSNSRCLWDEV